MIARDLYRIGCGEIGGDGQGLPAEACVLRRPGGGEPRPHASRRVQGIGRDPQTVGPEAEVHREGWDVPARRKILLQRETVPRCAPRDHGYADTVASVAVAETRDA